IDRDDSTREERYARGHFDARNRAAALGRRPERVRWRRPPQRPAADDPRARPGHPGRTPSPTPGIRSTSTTTTWRRTLPTGSPWNPPADPVRAHTRRAPDLPLDLPIRHGPMSPDPSRRIDRRTLIGAGAGAVLSAGAAVDALTASSPPDSPDPPSPGEALMTE